MLDLERGAKAKEAAALREPEAASAPDLSIPDLFGALGKGKSSVLTRDELLGAAFAKKIPGLSAAQVPKPLLWPRSMQPTSDAETRPGRGNRCIACIALQI